MANVYLHGEMGAIFGKEWNLEINSVAEAIAAITANTRGAFREYLINAGLKKEYVIYVGDKNISENDLHNPSVDDIHIMPKIEGGKKELQIVIGVVLIIIGAYYQQSWLVSIGIGMVLGGIAQMLTPVPKIDKTKPSTTIQSVDRAVVQGMPVPIAYGKVMVEGLPISVSITHTDTI